MEHQGMLLATALYPNTNALGRLFYGVQIFVNLAGRHFDMQKLRKLQYVLFGKFTHWKGFFSATLDKH